MNRIWCQHCGTTFPAGNSSCPHCGCALVAMDAPLGTRPSSAPDAPLDMDHFMLRGPDLVSKKVTVMDPMGGEVAQFVRPKLPLRGCLTVLCAPAAFLVLLVASTSVVGLAGHGQLPHLVSGTAGAVGIVGLVIAFLSPWVILQLMYPYNWLILYDPSDRRRKLLEVRQGWPLYVATARYRVIGPAKELLAVVRRNVIFNRFDVTDPKGRLLLRMSAKDPQANAVGFGIRVIVAFLLNALAAALFRMVSVPSLGHDDWRFSIWRCDTPGGQITECLGTFERLRKPSSTVRFDVRGASGKSVDCRLLFALGVAERFA